MDKCYYCGKELKNIKTKPEHIIPNAVGGKLTSKNILCNKCNNALSDLDQSLANSVYTLTNLFNPKRDNKTKSNLPLKYKYNDREFIREADGKYYSTKFKVEKQSDGKIKLHLDALYSADNGAKEKVIKPLLKAIDGIAKSYHWEDEKTNKIKNKSIEMFMNKVAEKHDAPVFNGQLELNKDKKLFLAMIKIAISFYASKNYDTNYILPAIDILKSKNSTRARKCCYYFYPKGFLYDDSIYHTIFLKGDNEQGILYCLVSIYGCVNCLILLNDNYTGEPLEECYCYDLRNHKERVFNNSIKLPKHDLISILTDVSENLPKDVTERLNLFISFLVQRKFSAEDLQSLVHQNYQNITKLGYLSKQDYVNLFETGLISLMCQHSEFKYFYEHQMLEIAQIAMIQYSYEYYLNDFLILKILSEFVSKIIIESIFEDKSMKSCIGRLKNDFKNYKTNIVEINDKLVENQEKYIEDLEFFIKEQYPKLKQITPQLNL